MRRVKALEAQTGETSAAQRQLELALQQARFEAAHARRQYDAVDPANRLVAGELERRWNEALQAVHRIEGEIAALEASKPAAFGREGAAAPDAARRRSRARLVASGCDRCDTQEDPARGIARDRRARRRRSYRDDPALAGRRPHRAEAQEEWSRQAPLDDTRGYLSLVRELARQMPDRQIARLLNRAGKPTGRGNGWTEARVRSFRSHHGIAVYREGEWAERGEITLEAAAQIMDVSVMTALRMIQRGIIKGRQLCRGAPWVIKAEDVAAYRAQNAPQRPLTADPAQQIFDFQ